MVGHQGTFCQLVIRWTSWPSVGDIWDIVQNGFVEILVTYFGSAPQPTVLALLREHWDEDRVGCGSAGRVASCADIGRETTGTRLYVFVSKKAVVSEIAVVAQDAHR